MMKKEGLYGTSKMLAPARDLVTEIKELIIETITEKIALSTKLF